MTQADQLRADLRRHADELKAERESKHRRAELLHLAGDIAARLAGTPLVQQSTVEGIAEAAVRIAAATIEAVDRASSPIQMLPRMPGMPGVIENTNG